MKIFFYFIRRVRLRPRCFLISEILETLQKGATRVCMQNVLPGYLHIKGLCDKVRGITLESDGIGGLSSLMYFSVQIHRLGSP